MNNKINAHASASAIITILCLALGGCDTEGAKGQSQLRATNCERKLVVVAEDCIGEITDTSVTLEQCSSLDSHDIAVDRVLVTEDGEIARVIAAVADDGVTLTTEDASLGDLEGAAGDTPSSSSFEDGLDDSLDGAFDISVQAAGKDFILEDSADILTSVRSDFDFQPDFDFDFDFDHSGFFPRLEAFKLVVGGSISASALLEVTTRTEGAKALKKEEKIQSTDRYDTIWLGPIPCNFSTRVTAYAETEIISTSDQPSSVAGAFEVDALVNFGPVYENGKWRFEHGGELKPSVTLINPEEPLEAKLGLRVEIETYLWNRFGGVFSVKPYVKFDFDPQQDVQYSGGVEPKVKFKMGRLGEYDEEPEPYNTI